MAVNYACLTLQRVVVPAVLVLAALFRPVGISFVYLLMFFISPFIPVATNRNFKGSVTAYFIILIAISTILLLCHIALQVIIISLKIDTFFGSCSFTEQLLRHVGFVDLRNLAILAIVEWLVPEVVVFITSLTVYLVTKKLIVIKETVLLENGEADAIRENLQNGASTSNDEGRTPVAAAGAVENTPTPSKGVGESTINTTLTERPIFDGLIKISPLFCLATLFFAAVLRPSVPGGFYFLIFLLSGSYWATCQSLQRGFALLLRFVMVVLVLHTLCIVSYQTPWMQQYLDKDNLIARLIGLEPLITSSCANDIRIIVYDTNFKLDSYLNPIVMFFSYYALALTTKNLIKPRVSLRREHRPMNTEPTETTPLVRHNTRKTRSSRTGSIHSGGSGNDIPLHERGESNVYESNVSLCDQISYGIVSIGGFIYQNSYIFTNILMMAWSIVYHSWLTFVLLLWANVLWMIPNQRKAMMRSSPFIAFYAEVLLIAQYIYGMALYNYELPAKVDTTGINLQQIGLDRPQDQGVQPCVPLIVKTSFVLMFWVTSRQFFKEKSEKRRSSTIADMIAPMQLTVSATGSSYKQSDSKKTSKFMKKAGDIIKNLLVRLWMWLLVLVIFLCAITGEQMTGFRICYMALFLFFLLVFQSSSKVWVKVMYGFWLFLIFYAMFILILIYTYQFDKFDQYWNDYLNISKTLQTDIGLEQYKTKDLFLHLVAPTIIVILTVIQVHYFHKRFIASLQQPPAASEAAPATSRSGNKTRRTSIHSDNISMAEGAPDLESLRDLVRIFFKKTKSKVKRILKNFKNTFWRFMELHIMKAVYISAFVSAVGEVCFLHIAFVGLCLVGVISRVSVQTFVSRVISFIVTIIILTKMIYQVAYLNHSNYDVSCDGSGNVTDNNAVWFGLEKTSSATGGLMGLLRKYIIYMVVVTLHAVVTLRQYQFRIIYGQQNVPVAKVLFPKVSRVDAEKNLENMVKYLFNYGFYKFGLEISLIMLVSTITYRQDVVAIAYAVWLAVLLSFNRSRCSKIWGIFQYFVTISIFVQYVLLVGFPPSLCLTYPWGGSIYSESIQRWTMLPGKLHYNHVPKLIFDFIMLLTINRQKRVFYLEQHNRENYPGGNNKTVVHDIANLNMMLSANPTKDFLSTVRNYLDVFKYATFCGFYWVTLAVVFLAGTNISDLLAIGYLIGAFIFLWEGSDFYLRPIHSIINRWNWLIVYNVANIITKTCFQMVGCLFMQELTTNCCWLVHVLGITCASKESNITDIANEVVPGGNECPAITRHVVLLWDAICFGFLILQMRIFKSHYFCHIIIDTKANSVLASRGAEIIKDLRHKQIEHRQEHESEVLLKIKRKMEKIRATQQKMLKPIDKPTHFDAVRAGDYYMFEDMDEKFELDLIEDEADFLADNAQLSESEKKLSRRKTLINTEQTKPKATDPPPSTSRVVPDEPDEPDGPSESKKKYDHDGIVEKDSDEDMEANPIVRLLEGFLVSLTIRLNRFSRNYRYVNKILAVEKKTLKERGSIHRVKRPNAPTSSFIFIKQNVDSDEHEDDALATSSSNTRNSNNNALNNTNIPTPPTPQNTTTIKQNVPLESQPLQQQQLPSQDPHVVDIELPLDTVDAKIARSNNESTKSTTSLPKLTDDFALYEGEDFASREHNIIIEVLISSWYAILSNTDLICYIVVFINQVVNASIISLPLPIMVFLWGTLSLPRPTKTFWVTLIAYTQAIVLIKCVFQYKLIWANYINLPNQPLALAKIFGIELNPNYATYDLVLLLVLFFHRFILKSQGLWKSEYHESAQRYEFSNSINDLSEEPVATNENALVRVNSNAMLPMSDAEIMDAEERSSIVESIQVEEDKYSDKIKRLKRAKYFSSLRKFFTNLVLKPRLPTDVYALMFLCDFINFFVLLFGFTAFGSQQAEGDGGVQTYLAENKVPIPFLIMLLVQFILIVIDRALYLRKALVNKIIFHFFSVIGIHIWMFFIVPAVTERSFYSLTPPIVFYIIKCFYMLLSSYQIKCGYPKRILGNFLTKGFTLVNMISFKVYMQMPFLYELRTILDWVCTDTTMTLFDWLKMEDIFSDIYFIKCSRQMEKDFPVIRAQRKTLYSKLLMGGTIILIIVISIWGPLCLFALGNAVGQANRPFETTVSIRIGSYDPIYSATNRENIFAFDEEKYNSMKNAYAKNRSAITFFSNYDSEDIAAVVLAGNSPSLWDVSPPDKERLLKELENVPITGSHMTIRFTYSLTRIPPSKGLHGVVGGEVKFDLDEKFEGRKTLIKVLKGESDEEIEIPSLIPKFLKILNSGESALVPALNLNNEQSYRPLVLKMLSDTNGIWWEIRDACNDEFFNSTLSKLPLHDCSSGVVMYTFNDKKFPSTFSFLTAGGIIGLYTTFVLLASRFLKSFIAGQNRKIMFEDLPYVDRVLQLCLDIYLVREALEFALEEDLFAKLIFLYRSPETMIKWTRPKEDLNDDDTDTESLRSFRRPEQQNLAPQN